MTLQTCWWNDGDNIIKVLPALFKNLNKNLLSIPNPKQDSLLHAFCPSFSLHPSTQFSTLFTTLFLKLKIISHRTVGHRQASSYLRSETDPVLKVPGPLSLSQNPQPDQGYAEGPQTDRGLMLWF